MQIAKRAVRIGCERIGVSICFRSFEAQLSKLGAIFNKANSPPRITARRGGGVTKKVARSLLIDAAGVVFLISSIGTPLCPREKRMLRDIFLIARPPLLAVMRGGEFAFFKMSPLKHISFS